MSVKQFQNIVMRGIVESTAGTDPGSGYADHEITQAVVPQMAVTSTPRNIVRNSHSSLSPSLTERRWEMTASLEIAGGGYSGGITEPAMSYLWQSAALKKTDALVLTIDNASGTFTVGEQVTNTTQASENTGKVASATATELILYDVENVPVDNDSLVGSDSSATCDVATTINEGLAYRPTSTRSEKKTVTYHAYLDGIRKVSVYSRSNLSLALGIGPKPSATFSLTGVFATPTDTANPSTSYQNITAPNFHGGTVVFGSVDMSDIAFTSIGVDFGNQIALRQNAPSSDAILGVESTDRNMSVTWDPEISTMADYNPFTLADNQTQNHLQYRWGSTQGNRHLVDFPGLVISNVTEVDANGIGRYNLTCTPEDVNSIDDSQFIYILY